MNELSANLCKLSVSISSSHAKGRDNQQLINARTLALSVTSFLTISFYSLSFLYQAEPLTEIAILYLLLWTAYSRLSNLKLYRLAAILLLERIFASSVLCFSLKC